MMPKPSCVIEGVPIYFVSPIARSVRTAVTDAARKLFKLTDVKTLKLVQVVPATVVEGPDGVRGFGVFVSPVAEIILAGNQWDADEIEIYWEDHVVGSLAHELAHYEQWRDGRPLIERGIRVRARNLLKRAGLPTDGV